jgi:hypothetical protein
MSKARERSVVNLQELYTVVVALALGSAIAKLIDPRVGHIPVRTATMPIFIAFLAVLVPFYHGAMRHLDLTYVEESGRSVRRGALLADFLLLFIEACLFFTAAELLRQPWYAAWTLVVLLGFDAAWGAVVQFALYTVKRRRLQLAWVYINVVAAPILAAVLIIDWPRRHIGSLSIGVGLAFMAATLFRTATDYLLGWDFYYPRGRDKEIAEPTSSP